MSDNDQNLIMTRMISEAMRKVVIAACAASVFLSLAFTCTTVWMGWQYSSLIQKIVDAGIEVTTTTTTTTDNTITTEQKAGENSTNTVTITR